MILTVVPNQNQGSKMKTYFRFCLKSGLNSTHSSNFCLNLCILIHKTINRIISSSEKTYRDIYNRAKSLSTNCSDVFVCCSLFIFNSPSPSLSLSPYLYLYLYLNLYLCLSLSLRLPTQNRSSILKAASKTHFCAPHTNILVQLTWWGDPAVKKCLGNYNLQPELKTSNLGPYSLPDFIERQKQKFHRNHPSKSKDKGWRLSFRPRFSQCDERLGLGRRNWRWGKSLGL